MFVGLPAFLVLVGCLLYFTQCIVYDCNAFFPLKKYNWKIFICCILGVLTFFLNKMTCSFGLDVFHVMLNGIMSFLFTDSFLMIFFLFWFFNDAGMFYSIASLINLDILHHLVLKKLLLIWSKFNLLAIFNLNADGFISNHVFAHPQAFYFHVWSGLAFEKLIWMWICTGEDGQLLVIH